MARGRIIVREISQDDRLSKLSLRSLCIFLLSIPHTDNDGCLPANPVSLKGLIAPMRKDIRTGHFRTAIDDFVRLGLSKLIDGNFNTKLLKHVDFEKSNESLSFLRMRKHRNEDLCEQVRTSSQCAMNRIEENRIEENINTGGKTSSPNVSPLQNSSLVAVSHPGKQIFKPPSLDEVRAYCRERKNSVDPGAWCDFYQSKGWMVGKNKMKDWRAAVRTWERNTSTKKPINPWETLRK